MSALYLHLVLTYTALTCTLFTRTIAVDTVPVTYETDMLQRTLPRTAAKAAASLRGLPLDGNTINANVKAAKVLHHQKLIIRLQIAAYRIGRDVVNGVNLPYHLSL